MAAIKGRDTSPELTVRRFLHDRGLRYRLHARNLPGRPDIVIRRLRTVVFVHGCFWHQHTGCRFAVMPKSNRVFWEAKLLGNRKRDRRTAALLRRAGWRVCTIWECSLSEGSLERLYGQITSPARRARD